jgi:uncharacterized membrane protein YhfC
MNITIAKRRSAAAGNPHYYPRPRLMHRFRNNRRTHTTVALNVAWFQIGTGGQETPLLGVNDSIHCLVYWEAVRCIRLNASNSSMNL